MQALQSGDPAQGKLYANYDRAVATLLRLEKERFVRIQEEGKLIDAEAAAVRFGKVLSQLRSQIERAELTFAPKANPDNPSKALKAYREFKDDVFRKISEYSPLVKDGSPPLGDDTIGIKAPVSPLSHLFPTVGDLEDEPPTGAGGSLEEFTDDALDEMGDENQ